jgi:hypothetical protein
MKRLSVLVLLTLVGLIAVAQSGKEFEKNANDAYQAKNYPKAFLDYSRAVEAYEKRRQSRHCSLLQYYNCWIQSKEI